MLLAGTIENILGRGQGFTEKATDKQETALTCRAQGPKAGLGILKFMDFPWWEEELENIPGIEEKGSRVCVKSIGNRKWLSGASKTHSTKEQPGSRGRAPPIASAPSVKPAQSQRPSVSRAPLHRCAVLAEVSDQQVRKNRDSYTVP